MLIAPIPEDEIERQAVLNSLNLTEKQEERFDMITRRAVEELRVPISTVSIIDRDREWYKSCQGLLAREGRRDISFCGHALLAKDMFIVEDTFLDERFKDNPYVIGEPHIRFYAGIALHHFGTGKAIGVFCVKDVVPRNFIMKDTEVFLDLADKAEMEINKR